ncbi:MAG: riboflavin synthase [Treponema sp.]|nr:riboflavin synthase [Treponema sp.]
MFTGIIEEIGKIKRISLSGKSGSLEIAANVVLEGTKIGDSIAVNGVCLTVTSLSEASFTADVMAETLRRSSLGSLTAGSSVNLERAMSAQGRFGGHIVSGHIDGTGKISKMKKEENAVWVFIEAKAEILSLIVEKGSIAIDGISLTVVSVTDSEFSVSVIPHTSKETTLLSKKAGDFVNLENDIVAKYVQKLLGSSISPVTTSQADEKILNWLKS